MLVSPWKRKLNLQDCFRISWNWAKNHDTCIIGGNCRYRSPDGLNACLIGALIPDEMYKKYSDIIEKNIVISEVIEKCPEIETLFDNIPIYELESLQNCHDINAPNKKGVVEALVIFSEKYHLQIPSQ